MIHTSIRRYLYLSFFLTLLALPGFAATLTIEKFDAPDPVLQGGLLSYTITVTNVAPADTATSVVVTDTLPAGVIVDTVTSSQGSCSTVANVVTCTLGSIGPEAAASVGIVVRPQNSGAIVNNVQATSTNSPTVSTTSSTQVNPAADLDMTKSNIPDNPCQGDTVRYELLLINRGLANVTSAVITDTLPLGVTFVPAGSDPTCSYNAGTRVLTCNVGAVPAGPPPTNQRILNVFVIANAAGAINNAATASSELPDPISANNTGQTLMNVRPAADLSLVKTSPPTAPRGGTLTYTLTVTNNGPSASTGSTLVDTLPGSVTFLSAPGNCVLSGAAGDGTGGGVTCTIGSLAVGASTQIQIAVRPEQAGSITNTATVSGIQCEQNIANNDSQVSTMIQPVANLQVTKIDAADPVAAGSNITYTVTLRNNGPNTAVNPVLTDTVPANTTFVSISNNGGFTCTTPPAGGTGNISCTAPTLSQGVTVTFTIVVNINGGTAGGTVISNTATGSSDTVDTTPGDNSDTETTTVLAVSDLSLTKTDSPDPVLAGQNITYTITLNRTGDAAATVSLTDVIPANTTFVSLSQSAGETFTCSTPAVGGTGTVTCTRASFTGTGKVFTLVVRVNPGTAAGTVITNTGNVTSPTDTTPGNNTDTTTTTVQASVDVSVVKTDSPDPVNAGSTVVYTVTTTNSGPSTATNVVVTDTPPAGVPFTVGSPSQGSCSSTATTITCNLGTLAPLASATFTVSVTPATAGTIANTAVVTRTEPDSNSANDTDTETTTVVAIDLSVTKTDSPDPVNVGQPITYTVTVNNAGPSTAAGVVVTDVLPAGVTLNSAVSTQGTCSGTATVICNVGSMASGATVTITIVVTPTTAGAKSNTVTVTSTTVDTDTSNNTDTEITTVNASLDLVLTKSDSPDPVAAGSALTYTVTVTNNGPSAATGVVVTDTLPAGVTFNSASSTQGTCSQASGTVTCTVGNMAVSAVVTATISVTPNAAGTLTNTATVVSTEADSNTVNNTDTELTTVNASLDLVLNKSDSPDPVTVGSALTYTVTVTNNGPSAATGVVITDTLPAGVTFNSASPTQGSCIQASGTVTCTVGNMAAAAIVTVTISVTPTTAGTLTNTATVVSTETDSNTSNNTDTEQTVVQGSAVITVTKTASPNPATVGQALVYTIVVTNTGASPATGVVVTDTLPSSVTYSSTTTTQGSCSQAGGVVTCQLGTINGSSNATVRITVTPTQAGTLSNVASVASNENPPVISPPSITPVNLPQEIDIPTVSEWGLIIMGLMLAFLAFVTMSRR